MEAPFYVLFGSRGERGEGKKRGEEKNTTSEFFFVAFLSLYRILSLACSLSKKKTLSLTPDSSHLRGDVKHVPDAGGRPEGHGVHPGGQDPRGGEGQEEVFVVASDAAAADATPAAPALFRVFRAAAAEAPPRPRPRDVSALLHPVQDDAAERDAERVGVLRQDQLSHVGEGGRGRDAQRLHWRRQRRREGDGGGRRRRRVERRRGGGGCGCSRRCRPNPPPPPPPRVGRTSSGGASVGMPPRCVTGWSLGGSSSGRSLALCLATSRSALRRSAAAKTSAWAGSAGATGGITATGATPALPTDTNVRYAEQQCLRSPVASTSSSTRTPTSAEERKTRLTIAATTATEPRRAGRRNATASTEAVTTGPRARVLAASPAATSIQERTAPPLLLLLLLLFGVFFGEREREGGIRELLFCRFFPFSPPPPPPPILSLPPFLPLSSQLTAADPKVVDVRRGHQLVEHDARRGHGHGVQGHRRRDRNLLLLLFLLLLLLLLLLPRRRPRSRSSRSSSSS